jgi:hypothetical protein
MISCHAPFTAGADFCSGSEAACKTLVAQRLKQSGMRWGQEGGQAILNLRGWAQSEGFDQAWALLDATFHAEVTLLNDVVSIRSRRL